MTFDRWPTFLRSGLSLVGTMHSPGRTSRRRRTVNPPRVDLLENRTLLNGSPPQTESPQDQIAIIAIPSQPTENGPGGIATLHSAPPPVGPETTPDGPGRSEGEYEAGTGVPALNPPPSTGEDGGDGINIAEGPDPTSLGQVPLSNNLNDTGSSNEGKLSSSETGSGAGHASVPDQGNSTGDKGSRDVQKAGPPSWYTFPVAIVERILDEVKSLRLTGDLREDFFVDRVGELLGSPWQPPLRTYIQKYIPDNGAAASLALAEGSKPLYALA